MRVITRSREMIDGIVAAIMALGRAMAKETPVKPTFYETNEVEFI